MPKVRFAMVGAGSVAQTYAQVFLESETAELVAVADTDLDAGARISALSACRVFDSHASLLRAGGFEAALICTPPSTHAFITLDLLRCGIPVLCETPLSVDVASARRMLHVADRIGVQLAMASKFRYLDDVAQTRAFITSGVLGEVLAFENSFASDVKMAAGWHAKRSVSGGGVIMDYGTHSVDLLRHLCGPVTAVAAYEGPRTQRLDVEDTAHLVARTAGGVLGSIDLSWCCDLDSENYVCIFGTSGAVTLGRTRSRFRHGLNSRWVSFGDGYDERAVLAAQLDNFCRALAGQEQLLIGPEDALASVEVIAAAYRSLRHDRWIGIENEETTARTAPGLTAVGSLR